MTLGQLKKYTVNLKSIDQAIGDPIVAGAGDANGRTLRVVFSQEAKEQLTKGTKVYLKWRHIQKDIRGYNVFTKVEDNDDSAFKPTVWEITWPQAMLHEGDAVAHIELVDKVSIACTQNFTVHILSDPDDGSSFVLSDDYSEFKKATIELASSTSEIDEQFDEWQKEFDTWDEVVTNASQSSQAALQKASDALAITDEFDDKLDRILDGKLTLEIEEF